MLITQINVKQKTIVSRYRLYVHYNEFEKCSIIMVINVRTLFRKQGVLDVEFSSFIPLNVYIANFIGQV